MLPDEAGRLRNSVSHGHDGRLDSFENLKHEAYQAHMAFDGGVELAGR